MFEEHDRLIDDLGGTTALARELGADVKAVSIWRRRGIAWRWRNAVAELARRKGKPLPKDFLRPVRAA